MIPPILVRVVQRFSRLPGLGSRSARRIVLHFLKNTHTVLQPLLEDLAMMAEKLHSCRECGLWDEQEVCSLCRNPERSARLLCVVADVADAWALERSACFQGKYHVLQGLMSAMGGVGPDTLQVDGLVERVVRTGVKEVILALSTSIEGQTTAYYIHHKLSELNPAPAVSLLGRGVPWGGEFDYLDEGTLTAAMAGRRPIHTDQE